LSALPLAVLVDMMPPPRPEPTYTLRGQSPAFQKTPVIELLARRPGGNIHV